MPRDAQSESRRPLEEVERSEHAMRCRAEDAERELALLRRKLDDLIPPAAIDAAARAVAEVTAGGIPFGVPRRKGGKVTVHAAVVARAAIEAYEVAKAGGARHAA